jgi:hypothetical protein
MICRPNNSKTRAKFGRSRREKKCKVENGSFHRIWMGVGGPSNFVTIVNRFPTHGQLLENLSNDRFVTIFGRNLVGAFHHHARLFRLQAVPFTDYPASIRDHDGGKINDFRPRHQAASDHPPPFQAPHNLPLRPSHPYNRLPHSALHFQLASTGRNGRLNPL